MTDNGDISTGLQSDAMCSACEMAVVWMQNQLRQNQTKEHILNYINEVGFSKLYFVEGFICIC